MAIESRAYASWRQSRHRPQHRHRPAKRKMRITYLVVRLTTSEMRSFFLHLVSRIRDRGWQLLKLECLFKGRKIARRNELLQCLHSTWKGASSVWNFEEIELPSAIVLLSGSMKNVDPHPPVLSRLARQRQRSRERHLS